MEFFLFFLFTNFVSAVSITGHTESCLQKAEVRAREGDRFVTVFIDGRRWILTSQEPFSLQAKRPVTFKSGRKDPIRGEAALEFQMTGVTMSSLPRLIVRKSGRQENCGVSIYGKTDEEQN